MKKIISKQDLEKILELLKKKKMRLLYDGYGDILDVNLVAIIESHLAQGEKLEKYQRLPKNIERELRLLRNYSE